MTRTARKTSGFARPVSPPRGGQAHGFGGPVKEPFIKRTAAALADSARDRAELARRRLAMKLKGHKYSCKGCGKTFRNKAASQRCAIAHARDNARNSRAAAKPPARGPHSCGCGKRFRNDLQLADHARLHAEQEDRAKRRETERTRRTEATRTRAARNGRPAGAPKDRGDRARPGQTRAERDAEWHAQRMRHAAGIVGRDGRLNPDAPKSPAKVRPRTPAAPSTR
jgi:hypothetical protein